MSLTLAMRMLNREIEVNTLNIYGQVVWYQSATLELRDIVREWVATLHFLAFNFHEDIPHGSALFGALYCRV